VRSTPKTACCSANPMHRQYATSSWVRARYRPLRLGSAQTGLMTARPRETCWGKGGGRIARAAYRHHKTRDDRDNRPWPSSPRRRDIRPSSPPATHVGLLARVRRGPAPPAQAAVHTTAASCRAPSRSHAAVAFKSLLRQGQYSRAHGFGDPPPPSYNRRQQDGRCNLAGTAPQLCQARLKNDLDDPGVE